MVTAGVRRPTGLGVVVPTIPQAAGPPPWWSDVPGLGADLERAGAGSLWALDHVGWWAPSLDCLTVAALLAAGTRRATVGTGVLQLPLRDPALVAKAAATLQVTSGGRFVLGVGTGSHAGEFARLGGDFADRRAALARGVDDVRRWWRPGDDAYDQRPAPGPTPVPVWVGGSAPSALRLAGRVGDGWLPHQLDPEAFAARARTVRTAAEAAARDAGAVTLAPLVYAAVGPAGPARERGRAWLASLFRVDADRIDRHLVAGPADRVAARLAEYAEAGADHVVVMVAADDPRPELAELAAACGPAHGLRT